MNVKIDFASVRREEIGRQAIGRKQEMTELFLRIGPPKVRRKCSYAVVLVPYAAGEA